MVRIFIYWLSFERLFTAIEMPVAKPLAFNQLLLDDPSDGPFTVGGVEAPWMQ